MFSAQSTEDLTIFSRQLLVLQHVWNSCPHQISGGATGAFEQLEIVAATYDDPKAAVACVGRVILVNASHHPDIEFDHGAPLFPVRLVFVTQLGNGSICEALPVVGQHALEIRARQQD